LGVSISDAQCYALASLNFAARRSMATQAFDFSVLKVGAPRHSTVLLLALVAGCTSTPDGTSVDGDGGSDTAGATGGVMNATGGGAVESSGGFETGGAGMGAGGSGASDSGGASAGGGAVASGGTTSTGGAEGVGGATSTGGAEGTGACSGLGEVSFVASFDESVDDSFRPGLSACIATAGTLWNELLTVPFAVTLEVLVSYDPSISTANGRSTTSVAWNSADDIYEVSAAHEIRTGVDPNGATEDIQINFGTSLTNGTYWFDPDPTERTFAIPSGKVDVLSTCTHELGHAIAFSGARSASTGNLPGYSFLYDEHSTAIGSYYYFSGAHAEAAYGAEVPLNTQILDHLGNVSPAPGYDLDLDLMHGTPTRYQQRYYPTDVDAGILADLGLPVTGTSAADAVCSALQVRAKASGDTKLGPAPAFVE
jgi:hypothetical protein